MGGKGNEKVAEHIEEEHVEECLSRLSFPERIRTTDGLERLNNQEIKRRARAVRIFPNREARAYAPSDGARGRAERGLGHGEALPGHARTSKNTT